MKIYSLLLAATLAVTAQAQQVIQPAQPVITPTPCSDVKDASDPRDVVLIGEVHVGTLAEAIKNYPALKAKLQAAATKFAKEKESALLKAVANDNPNRNPPKAKTKMEEFISAGIPISKATQDAVNAALPPAMRPQPTPTPTPSDGLD